MKIFNWIKSFFANTLKAFMNQIFTRAKQEVIAALKDIALQAVIKLADTDLSNEDKRRQAFAEIKAYAVGRGMKVSDSLVNLVLEMSVQAIKG